MIDYNFKQVCCVKKPLKKFIYNPELIYRFPRNILISQQIMSSIGTANQCYTVANKTLNAYGKWAGCPGGSGPGYSSTMNYRPNENGSGLGPNIGVPHGGPATTNRNG